MADAKTTHRTPAKKDTPAVAVEAVEQPSVETALDDLMADPDMGVMLRIASAFAERLRGGEQPTDTEALFEKLSGPFEPDAVEWKPQTLTRDKKKAMAVAYLSNRAIQDRLDAAVGPAAWRNEYRPGPNGGVVCGISIRVVQPDGRGEWVTKWDGADNTQIEGTKGGLSDSMKRAAVQWGIGRFLYRLPAQWVPVDEHGRFVKKPELPPAFRPKRTKDERATNPRHDDEVRRSAEGRFHVVGSKWSGLIQGLVSVKDEWDAQRPRVIGAYCEANDILTERNSTSELTTDQLRELTDSIEQRLDARYPPRKVYTAMKEAAPTAPKPAPTVLTAEEREAIESGEIADPNGVLPWDDDDETGWLGADVANGGSAHD